MTTTTKTAEKTAARVVLHRDKDCKGSIRYVTEDDKAPVSNVYLSRTFADPMPQTIAVTVEGLQ